MIEFILKSVNEMFELKEQLEKTYGEVITGHDSEGYHVIADTSSLKTRN